MAFTPNERGRSRLATSHINLISYFGVNGLCERDGCCNLVIANIHYSKLSSYMRVRRKSSEITYTPRRSLNLSTFLTDWHVSQQAVPRIDGTGAFLAVLSAVIFGSKVARRKPAPQSLLHMAGVRKDAGVRRESHSASRVIPTSTELCVHFLRTDPL
jgi:hypothetical protein